MTSRQQPTQQSSMPDETAPDPDEDDLDDLDDVLDEFSATKISPNAPPPPPPPPPTATAPTTKPQPSPPSSTEAARGPDQSGPSRSSEAPHDAASPPPATAKDADPTKEEADFATQLQTGMAEMMRELEMNPEMAQQFEQMMAGFDGAATASSDGKSSSISKAAPNPNPNASSDSATSTIRNAKHEPKLANDATFQDTIKRTMERMRTSNASATSAATTTTDPANANENDMMTSLLASLANGKDTPEDSDAFSTLLLSMMESLTNKEILYEPMLELCQKFPSWLSDRAPGRLKADSITEEERTRYQEQARLVGEIVSRFEREGYSDSNSADREYIVERMQKMQEAGAPPAEL